LLPLCQQTNTHFSKFLKNFIIGRPLKESNSSKQKCLRKYNTFGRADYFLRSPLRFSTGHCKFRNNSSKTKKNRVILRAYPNPDTSGFALASYSFALLKDPDVSGNGAQRSESRCIGTLRWPDSSALRLPLRLIQGKLSLASE